MKPVEIICTGCSTTLNIPDHRIPKGKKSSFLCPKCQQRLYINPDVPGDAGKSDFPPRGPAAGEPAPGIPDYDVSERPFDYLDDNAETALICMGDPTSALASRTALEEMKYHVEKVGDVRTALTRMKYHLFNIILVDETFDTPHRGSSTLLQELRELDMGLRRQIVVILASRHLRTQDNMAALNNSVNVIINHKEMTSNALNIFQKSIKDHKQFYAIFNETLKKTGKG